MTGIEFEGQVLRAQQLPPSVASNSGIDVTQAPYSALSSSEDVSAAFQAAANAAKEAANNDKTRRELLLNPRKGGYWLIKSGLTFDMAFLIVRGAGATIDSSAFATGPALLLTGTADQLDGGQPYGNAVSGIDHLTLRGPGQEAASTAAGIKLESSGSQVGPSRVKLSNMAIAGYHAGVRFEKNTYCVTLDNLDIWHCAYGLFDSPASNEGERITATGCQIFNGGVGVFWESGPSDLHLINCSLDYLTEAMIVVNEGCVSFTDGHIEGKGNKLWFEMAADPTVRLDISDTTVVLAEAKTNYPFGSVPVGCDGLNLDKVKFVFEAAYNRGCLFDGLGPVTARGISWGWPSGTSTSWMPPISRSLNLVEGEFAAGTTPGWTTVKNVTPHNEGGFTTGRVTLQTANNGENVNLAQVILVEPGRALLSSYKFESSKMVENALTLNHKVIWLRSDGSVISEQTLSQIKEEDIASPWTLKMPTAVIVPPGAVQAKVEWGGTNWAKAAAVSLSDIIVNVV
jgi:hypothetical protein